ncbi:hypothetical protein TEA_025524 [Camellia sinensis var. sinensis]|uniref:Uncharacterized protein n=1 Tax=Camellia sinensis var. sinensis TaxID=542762 RepID=A0A4S4DVR3_CAMSN|nr:hypothetical protein TEA_025524 [Camellia sinensis var. sinensis]
MVDFARVQKELQECNKDNDVSGISIKPIGDNLTHLAGTIPGPLATPYEGGTFNIDIILPDGYPFEPPRMQFATKVWEKRMEQSFGRQKEKLGDDENGNKSSLGMAQAKMVQDFVGLRKRFLDCKHQAILGSTQALEAWGSLPCSKDIVHVKFRSGTPEIRFLVGSRSDHYARMSVDNSTFPKRYPIWPRLLPHPLLESTIAPPFSHSIAIPFATLVATPFASLIHNSKPPDNIPCPFSSLIPSIIEGVEGKKEIALVVWHPNISSQSGAICLDILKDQWSPALTLKTALLSVQALLSAPEPDDPQDAVVAQQYLRDYQTFAATARYWTETFARTSALGVEEKVQKLVEMGFPEALVRSTLESVGGDENMALEKLCSG